MSTSWCTTVGRSGTRCSCPSSDRSARDHVRLTRRHGVRRRQGQARQARRQARDRDRGPADEPLPAALPEDRRAHPGRGPRRGAAADRRGGDRVCRDEDLQRPAHRQTGVPPGDGAGDRRALAADDVLRQGQAHLRVAGEAAAGRAARSLPRPGGPVPGPVAADQPDDAAVRRDRRRRNRRYRRPTTRSTPHQGRRLLGHPACGDVRAHRARHPRGPARGDPQRPPGAGRAHRLRLDPRARRLQPGVAGAAAVPVRGGAGHPAGAGPPSARDPGAGSRGSQRRRRRSADGLRCPAAVRAHRRTARDRRRRSRTTWLSRTR